MSPLRLALVGAVVGACAWIAKGIAIAAAGGLDKSPLEGPLWMLGMLAMVTAFGALGAGLVRSRHVWRRATAGLLGVLCGVLLSLLVQSGVSRLFPQNSGWVSNEAGLWVVGLLAVGATYAALRSAQRATV